MKRDALTHLADLLMEDIVNAPHEELLAEEAQEFRDWRELVAKFDTILAKTSAFPASQLSTTPVSDGWNLADGWCEEIFNTPHEALLREADEDFGDYRVITDEFDDIVNRGLCVDSPAPQPNAILCLRFWSSIHFRKLFDWLKRPLQHRPEWGAAACGALAALLIVAVLFSGIYQLSHQFYSSDASPALMAQRSALASQGDLAFLHEPSRKSAAAAAIEAREADIQARARFAETYSRGASDTKTGISALEYAAANGHTIAQWKLGRMYADGDGVKQDELRAFEYFRGIADAHAEEAPGTPQARFVANAFVALGNYYLEGIPDTAIKPDADRALQMFAYAASYFGDPDAQYRLGRMYLDGNGGLKEPKQAARWLSLAARKGQYQAQAVLGAMLFKGEYTPRQAARGLMWLTLARDGASSQDTWISDLYAAALKHATDEERAGALAYLERWLKGQRDTSEESAVLADQQRPDVPRNPTIAPDSLPGTSFGLFGGRSRPAIRR